MSEDDDAALDETAAPSVDGISSAANATVPDTEPGVAPPPATGAAVRGARIARYRLIERLGAGAMGEVWRAHDPQLDRQVAIKLVHPRLARSPDVAARMLREARAMAKLSHRGVVTVHDAGDSDGRLFIAMELVRGRTLGALLRARSADERADWRRWLAMMLAAGRGLAAAHAAGVLHRDFKPDNVLVEASGRVCVGDFGLASLGDAPRERVSLPVLETSPDADLTATGALLGTPAYMSPEQLYGSEVDARADQFAFCVATHEALYGIRPFALRDDERGNLAALLDVIEQRALCTVPADSPVPAALRELLARGLAPRAADRWPDLEALLAELAPFAAPNFAPRHRRTRWIGALATAFAIAALAVAGAALFGRGSSPVVRPSQPVAAEPSLVPRPIQTVSLRAALALSAGGRLAIGTDRMQVLDLDHGTRWQVALPPSVDNTWTERIEFDGESILRWRQLGEKKRIRWPFAANQQLEHLPAPAGRWIGGDDDGEFIVRDVDGKRQIEHLRAGTVLQAWPVDRDFDPVVTASVSPSHGRLAYIEPIDRYQNRIVVLDAASGTVLRSSAMIGLVSLSWRTDGVLLYGTAGESAAIYELTVRPQGLGTARQLFAPTASWIGAMVANHDRIVYGDVITENRARIVSEDLAKRRDFEAAEVATALGWRRDGSFVAWNQTSLELRDTRGARTTLPIALPHVPQSATIAGDLLVVTMRGTTGRELAAYDLASGARTATWHKPEGAALTARCAGDLEPPCFIARRATADAYEIVELDPATGDTGDDVRFRGRLEDFAVAADGKRLLVVTPGEGASTAVTELGPGGRRDIVVPITSVRSIAIGLDGAIVVAGASGPNRYIVEAARDDEFNVLLRADGEQLSLVRPSPDGHRVLVLGRQRKIELWELKLPPDR